MPEGEEKSFPATPKRRAEARKKGQIARSPEFGAAATLLAVVIALHALFSDGAGLSFLASLQSGFHFTANDTLTFTEAHRRLIVAALWGSRLVVPVLLLCLLLALASGIAQAGFQITPEALAPKWQHVNPLTGLQRLFSMQGTVGLLKGSLKLFLVGGLCAFTVHADIASGELLNLMGAPLPVCLGVVGNILWTLGLRIGLTLFLLAAADYIYQKRVFDKGLMMSAQDIKQEMKQSEGNPEIKNRIRRIQREMSRRRMMEDVPKATVIVTNPTHYAVALLYEPGMGAPKVVAKGRDEIARRIKEVAREHQVPLVENKPLAQALHKTVEIGREIPADLYEAVAQVLAFVYRTSRRQPARPTPAPRPSGV